MAPLPVGQMFQVNIYIKADHRNRSYDDHQYIHDDFSDSAGLLLKHTPKTNNMIRFILASIDLAYIFSLNSYDFVRAEETLTDPVQNFSQACLCLF